MSAAVDVGLVCDVCDTFNPMASPACSACKSPLALGGNRKKKSTTPPPEMPPPKAEGTPRPQTPPPSSFTAEATVSRGSGSKPGQKICGECGTPIQPGFKFCGSCGAKVPESKGADGPRRTMFFGAMQAARAKLVLIRGDGLDGVSFTLAGQDHIAGRVEGPLLFADDPFLSPKHANFYYKDNKIHVRDESPSGNGVFVRTRAPVPLKTGDRFLVGEQLMRVETTPPETAGLGPDDEGTYVFASPRRASRMRLVQLLRGGDYGLIFRATSDVITLGREGNDVNFPEDPFISGRHAQVAFNDAGLMLTDLGSKNGTFVRIREDTPLSHGDYVFMGQQLLRVEIV
jgi:pSer/pThr/pTyr-binding forkhead associated (FHA) protein